MKIGKRAQYDGVLDIPEGEVDGVKIRHILKPAGWKVESGNARTMMFGQKSQTLYFAEETRWHELSENEQGVWMTDLPIEQRQMDTLIEDAHGDVLIGGLGVGYAAVALSRLPKVKTITVVEKNPAVVQLVWDATVAKMTPKPITIYTADLFEYLKNQQAMLPSPALQLVMGGRTFDWGLLDIWQSDSEHTFHTMVLPLLELSRGVVKTVKCWNEDVMRGQLLSSLESRRMMFTVRRQAEASAVPVEHQSLLHMFDHMPPLEEFCEPRNSIYHDWAVPFWRWFRDHATGLDDQIVQSIMMAYVRTYGRPEMPDPIKAFFEFGGMHREVGEPKFGPALGKTTVDQR